MRLACCLIAIVACEKSELPPETPKIDDKIDLPQVAGTGFEPANREPSAAVIVDKTALVVDGKVVVAIKDRAFDPAEIEGGKQGMKILKLAALGPVLKGRAGDAPVALLLDRGSDYLTFIRTMFSLKQKGGPKEFALYARANGALVAAPITLPDRAPTDVVRVERPNPDEQPLGMFVSITKGRVIVWSSSRLEGSLTDPRKVIPWSATAAAELHRELADIVKRRWGGKKRPPDTHSIVIQADSDTSIQIVADVIGAVRRASDGTDVFPNIRFSMGFE